ncbi:NTP transferase domain-containing protein [Corynebacterium glyciniphilum]|uniref:NTP transferase domain-containing protein n=1 Tax=Corynebacterium glyciniphilum TaxID=1404244 RepID=UPI00264F9088|nr:NTP transferase domain-containing protein [Corynebacterium glyciniphilum]MDN5682854.1 nucleotidyltransferase family protein [Corynebacterium glyciniphilum]MDN6705171.1 nucleotidyltransferase family protein [Corynebacterium glyciniphilum]
MADSSVHAIIVAGGAGSRLAASAPAGALRDVPRKPLLPGPDGRRLIDRVLDATASCACRVVVTPPPDLPGLPVDVLRTQEDPPLAGPAAALAAGVAALHSNGTAGDADPVLLLAADLVAPAGSVDVLLKSVQDAPAGCIGTVDGRMQPLLSVVRFGALRTAVDGNDFTDAPAMALLRRLDLQETPLPSAADIDTWDDAVTHGYGRTS